MSFVRAKRLTLAAAAVAALLGVGAASSDLRVAHLYNLSDFTGVVPYNDAVITIDDAHDEIYVADGAGVRIFNGSGMEIHRFGEDGSFGIIRGLAVQPDGRIVVLAYDPTSSPERPKWSLVWCDYRGTPVSTIPLRGLPASLSRFAPDRLFLVGGKLLLVSESQLRAVIATTDGEFVEARDLAAYAGVAEKDRDVTTIGGCSVDRGGNLLFTVPVQFQAYVVSPDGHVRSFGKAGSAPGGFGVASGIAADERGDLFVADRQRGVVMVFDPMFRFVREFGYSSDGPGALVRPTGLAFGEDGRLYVTQLRNRGVAVYAVASQ